MSGVPSFPELNLSQRPELFNALLSHPFESDVVEARFGGRTGWVILDPTRARKLLRRHDLPKSRSAVSREEVGGYAAREAASFHRGRSAVVLGLARSAYDVNALASSLVATIGTVPPDRSKAPAAFTQWMLHDLLGGEPVDLTTLKQGVTAMEALAESAQTGSPHPYGVTDARAALATTLAERVVEARSPFLDVLRGRGWAILEIVDELLNLVIAGWESTAAAVSTALTVGLPTHTRAADIAELLRLYPPSWLIARTMTGSEPWGAAGDLAVISPWLSHRTSAWRDSERFDPERTNNIAAFPFGVGPRRCPADLYARTQVAVALSVFGGGKPVRGRPALIGHRSATLIPDMEIST